VASLSCRSAIPQERKAYAGFIRSRKSASSSARTLA
jgi:hypothetical protein